MAERRQKRKAARAAEAARIVGDNRFENVPVEIEDDSSEEENVDIGSSQFEGDKIAKHIKKGQKKRAAAGAAAARAEQEAPNDARSSGGGIKTAPLILLILLTGTTVLPALLYAGDWLGATMQKKHFLGSIGYKFGIGPSPKKRVMSFYEKHDPAKIESVPTILAQYYGDYSKLTKKLERKYGDYGYFLNWEQDEAPMTLAKEKLEDTYIYLGKQFNKHAPQIIKTGARNMKYNLGFLYKKAKRIWKKKVWPILEPYFGVPKGAAEQKRKDAQEARRRKRGKRNTEFRDDDEF